VKGERGCSCCGDPTLAHALPSTSGPGLTDAVDVDVDTRVFSGSEFGGPFVDARLSAAKAIFCSRVGPSDGCGASVATSRRMVDGSAVLDGGEDTSTMVASVEDWAAVDAALTSGLSCSREEPSEEPEEPDAEPEPEPDPDVAVAVFVLLARTNLPVLLVRTRLT